MCAIRMLNLATIAFELIAIMNTIPQAYVIQYLRMFSLNTLFLIVLVVLLEHSTSFVKMNNTNPSYNKQSGIPYHVRPKYRRRRCSSEQHVLML